MMDGGWWMVECCRWGNVGDGWMLSVGDRWMLSVVDGWMSGDVRWREILRWMGLLNRNRNLLKQK